MYSLIIGVHVVIAIMIVIAVLLQSGKGGGLGSGMGGGSNTLFGSSGGSNFFTKLTTGLAIAFMCTSLALTMIRSKELKTSIFDQSQTPPAAAPSADAAAPVSAPAPAASEAPKK